MLSFQGNLLLHYKKHKTPVLLQICGHLLRRTPKINAQRISDTLPLYFWLSPCICTVSLQKATFANMRRIYCVATQIPILNVQQVRLRLEFARRLVSASPLCKGLRRVITVCRYWNPQRIRSGTDAAGSRQKQVCRANLQLKNVHGRTFLSEDGGGLNSIDVLGASLKLEVKECTRKYIPWRGILGYTVDWCSASTMSLLSTRYDTSLAKLI